MAQERVTDRDVFRADGESHMFRLKIASVILAVVLINIQPRTSWSTSGWLVIDAKSVQGTWLALDLESEEVYRLEIRGTNALLAMIGPTQSEFLFRSSEFTVKKGRLFTRMAKEPGSMVLDVTGEGRATVMGGTMTLVLKFAKQDYPPWKERTVVFVKECCGPILDVLAKSDKRARAAVERALKGNDRLTTEPKEEGQGEGRSQELEPKARDASHM